LPTIDKVQDVPLITFVLAAAALVGALWVAVALDCWAVTEAPPDDADTHEIVAVELTVDDVGDVSMTPDQIEGLVGSMTTDGAYDGRWLMMLSRNVIPTQRSSFPSVNGGSKRNPDDSARSTSTDDYRAWAH
jgi:hypothetical protein